MIVFHLLLLSTVIKFSESVYYECREPLFDRSVVSATSSLSQRDPSKAKLYSDNVWTASQADMDQYFVMELENTMMVTAVSTQGRHSPPEYVLEYSVSYGSNGNDYADYKLSTGHVKMFKGNVDGNNVTTNDFDVPIIARFIRINPTRWKERISMRVELYGCPYSADTIHFNGTALLQWDLRSYPIYSSMEAIKFRMKTNVANGVIMYSRGTQGDYFALQLKENKMLLNLNLGNEVSTSLWCGSLLDDNIWHEVVISRTKKKIIFSIDRVTVESVVVGEFSNLNLDFAFYIGGVPTRQKGIIVYQNYTGCMENLYINATNVIHTVKNAYDTRDQWGMDVFKQYNTVFFCPAADPFGIPVTFLTDASHAKLKGPGGLNYVKASLSFRTFESEGVILYHKFQSLGYLKLFLEKGYLKIDLVVDKMPKSGAPATQSVILDVVEYPLNDGRWHDVSVSVTTGVLELTVDEIVMPTKRKMSVVSNIEYFVGGGLPGSPGFIGCMRKIVIDGASKHPTDWKLNMDYCCKNEITFGTCQTIDRCNPNPCKHGGICRQNSKEFFCDCSNIGYGGAVCHTPLHPLSCEAYKMANPVQQRADIKIDVDGSGPLDPFPVTCQFNADGRVVTEVHHKHEESLPVNGFQDEGSYKQDIIYDANIEQIEVLLERSNECWQNVRYRCRQSRLLNSPSNEYDFRPFGWWVSRRNQKMDFWGGSIPGSRMCSCGVYGQCVDKTKWCNCDAGRDTWEEDGGDIKGKEHLPVKQLRFGDTGTAIDDKEAFYSLGPLMCEGDNLFSNVVTFRITDATLNLPTFDFGYSGDIYMEFKTTVEKGVLLHSRGPDDEILVELIGGSSIQFTYKAGSGPIVLLGQPAYKLADNRWHSVSIERNMKGARLSIDGAEQDDKKESTGPVRTLQLTSDLVIGATVDNRNGFTGCMRAFLLNGKLVDLVSYAHRANYGVSIGCIGKCDSNPCQNNGTCEDRYGDYKCDCRWTAFKGPICADEIGVTLRENDFIRYDFMGDFRSTIAENIRVGFTTIKTQGFLLGLTSNKTGEFMTILVSNSGNLRVVFDFGFERQDVVYPHVHLGRGQFHDVRIRRKNAGSTLVLDVDDYDPLEFNFTVKESADAQFNNIQHLYIGRNETMSTGFDGCISRVEFDDIYPLKYLFQQNGPTNIHVPRPVAEDFCGIEPITHPPIAKETRPNIPIDPDSLPHPVDAATIAGIVLMLLILLISLLFFGARFVSNQKGDYVTQEDRGADMATDQDTAVMHSTTGHHVQKKREWFI